MKLRLFTLCLSVVLIFSGCGSVGSGLSQAYNMTKCEYNYKSISNLNLAGMNLSRGVSVTALPAILSLLSGNASSIPLNFTLNLDVKNPNAAAAAFNGLQYIISIDDIQFTSGQVNQSMNIAAGASQTLPLNIGVDLATLMKSNSKSAVENITKNFLGIGSEKSNVTVQLKPTFMVGNTPVTSPVYIPVSFSFGGK